MKYAVIATGGKQYKVSEGDTISIEKLVVEVGKEVIFDKVLFFADGAAFQLGTPHLVGATVTAEVLEQFKSEKIRVAKFKAKARYRKVYGHRQDLTKVKIGKIVLKGAEKKKVTSSGTAGSVQGEKEEVKAKPQKSA